MSDVDRDRPETGCRVRVLRGVNAGRTGTVVKRNGSYPYVILHGDDEVVVRGPGDLSRDAPLYVVPIGAARLVEPIYPSINNLIEVTA